MMASTSVDRPWTVLVFMVVEDAVIESFALADLRQIERIGDTGSVDVVVQLHWHEAPYERYHLRNGTLAPVAPSVPTCGVGRAEALRAFVNDAVQRHPARHYVVMLWGHAYGIGFGRRAEDRLSFTDLTSIFREFSAARGGVKLEILAGNACRMAKLEAVYELRDAVRYLVASQAGVPYQGWPIRELLTDLVRAPAMSPTEYARGMVTRFTDWYRQRTLTMTMLDLEASDVVLARLRTLADLMMRAVEHSPDEARCIHAAYVQAASDVEESEPIVDLHVLCAKVAALCQSAEIRAAASEALEALSASGLVAKHDGFGSGAPDLHGLSVYVPHVTLDAALPLRAELGLQHAALWSEAIAALQARQSLAHVLETVSRLELDTLRSASVPPHRRS